MKRYVISSINTFLAAFLLSLGDQLLRLDINALEGLGWSAIAAFAVTLVRLAVKAGYERLIKDLLFKKK